MVAETPSTRKNKRNPFEKVCRHSEKGDNVSLNPPQTSLPTREETSGTIMPPPPVALIRNTDRTVLSRPGAMRVTALLRSAEHREADEGEFDEMTTTTTTTTMDSAIACPPGQVQRGMMPVDLVNNSPLVNAELVVPDLEQGSMPVASVAPATSTTSLQQPTLVKAEAVSTIRHVANKDVSIKELLRIRSVRLILVCLLLLVISVGVILAASELEFD